MSVIYVLIERGGEYEDAWQRNVVASPDRTKIELKMQEEQDEIAALRAWQEVRRIFLKDWEAANPRPELGTKPTLKVAPRWTNLHQHEITTELRAERKAIEEENSRATVAWAKPLADWHLRFDAIDREFIAAAGYKKKHTTHEAIDVHYEIETINLI